MIMAPGARNPPAATEQFGNFLSPTVLTCRQFCSHCRHGQDKDKTKHYSLVMSACRRCELSIAVWLNTVRSLLFLCPRIHRQICRPPLCCEIHSTPKTHFIFVNSPSRRGSRLHAARTLTPSQLCNTSALLIPLFPGPCGAGLGLRNILVGLNVLQLYALQKLTVATVNVKI